MSYWALHRCESCGSLTALPRPSQAHQVDLHRDIRYFEHPYFDLRRDRSLVEQRCRETFGRVYPGHVPRELRHLDVGSDTGEYLLAGRRLFGTIPTGVEIAQLAAEEARSEGLTIYVEPLESMPKQAGKFDLITAIDLVEHLAEPRAFFDAVRQRLSEHGLFYVETPNPHSVIYKLGRLLTTITAGHPRWVCERLFLREHIQYFTRSGLVRLADAAGLTPLKLETRRLASRDISAGLTVRGAMSALQKLDRRPSGQGILIWGVFTATLN